ncbi:MAG: hypothetical protein R3E54_13095 [Halioglobus sp.]
MQAETKLAREHVLQFARQRIAGIRPQPLRVRVGRRRDSQVPLDRQFQVHVNAAFTTVIKAVELAERAARDMYRQIMREQFGGGIGREKELPEPFEIQPDARTAGARQECQQRRGVVIQRLQPRAPRRRECGPRVTQPGVRAGNIGGEQQRLAEAGRRQVAHRLCPVGINRNLCDRLPVQRYTTSS